VGKNQGVSFRENQGITNKVKAKLTCEVHKVQEEEMR
jgi:hypothetical protein